MSYGALLMNSENSILLDDSETGYGYYGKRVNGVGANVPSNIPQIVFTHYSSSWSGYPLDNITSGVTEYIFIPFKNIPVDVSHGLVIYNDSGDVHFHSGRPPLMMLHSDDGLSKVACNPLLDSSRGDSNGGGIEYGSVEETWIVAIGADVKTKRWDWDNVITEDFNYDSPYTVGVTPRIDATYYDTFDNLT